MTHFQAAQSMGICRCLEACWESSKSWEEWQGERRGKIWVGAGKAGKWNFNGKNEWKKEREDKEAYKVNEDVEKEDKNYNV